MSNPHPPQILSDLYRDLRDRRMLAPAIALLVAILAVPLLLSSSAPEQVAPLAPAATVEGAAATDPAVLVEQAGIRDYRKRLSALKSKNPFDQQFTLPPPGAAVVEEVDGGLAVSASTGETADVVEPLGTATASSSSPVGPASVPTATSDDSDVATSGGVAPASEPTEAIEATPPPPEIRFYAGRVDVSMGLLGEAKEYTDVRYLSFLPNEQAPVVAYLGLLEGGDEAIFSISSAVTMGEGEGSCAPKKPAPCQFLTLKVGEERYMTYGTDGATYRLKLLDTEIVSVPDPRDPADRDNLDE